MNLYEIANNIISYVDPATTYLAMDALKHVQSELIVSVHDVTIYVIYLGARDGVETEMDFKLNFEYFQDVFPSCRILNIALIGDEVCNRVERTVAPGCTVTSYGGLYHDVYNRLPVHFQAPHVVVLLCPGFSANSGLSWSPIMKLLQDNNTVCICSGYSGESRWSSDGAVDDYLLETRYRAKVLIGKTLTVL